MKLSVREDSTNYACTVVELPPMQDVIGLDNLKRVTIFGNDFLVGKDSNPDDLYLFFPAESQLSEEFCRDNNLFRDSTKNIDQTKKGFFEDNRRVKAIKFKGIISTGFVIPISALPDELHLAKGIGTILSPGDEFTDINGVNICKKYKIVRIHSTTSKESRFNKKLKRFDKLVPNQFRFHTDTSHLAKNLHLFKTDDIIVITDKWHGTSAVFANVLINRKLSILDKVAKLFGVPVVDKVYDNLYSSRSVIKNQYINKEQGGGYYGED